MQRPLPFAKRPSIRWCVAALAMAGFHQACHAWPDTVVVTGGIVRIYPRTTSGPLTVREIGGQPVEMPQEGTSVESLPANTATFAVEWLGEHVGVQLALGVPPTHQLRGTGTLEPAGVLGEGQQWSPAVLVKYHFGEPAAKVRPYLGAGLDYTFFRKTRITNDAFRMQAYGPNSTTTTSVNSSWNPLAVVGTDFRIDSRWLVGVSLAYAPLKARITTDADNTSLGVPLRVTTDIHNHTVAGAIYVGYRFGKAP